MSRFPPDPPPAADRIDALLSEAIESARRIRGLLRERRELRGEERIDNVVCLPVREPRQGERPKLD